MYSVFTSKFKTRLPQTLLASSALTAVAGSLLSACGGAHMPLDVTASVAISGSTTGTKVARKGVSYERLKKVIDKNCTTACHGPSTPPTQPNWQDFKTTFARRDSILRRVVTLKDMPKGLSMSDADRALFSDWVNSGALEHESDLPVDTAGQIAEDTTPPPAVAVPGASLPGLEGDLPSQIRAGNETFKANCFICHGMTGRGDGIMRAALQATNSPLPRNFHDEAFKAGDKPEEIYKTLTDGLMTSDGKPTGMPGFGTSLSDKQRSEMTMFIWGIRNKDPVAMELTAEPTSVPKNSESDIK